MTSNEVQGLAFKVCLIATLRMMVTISMIAGTVAYAQESTEFDQYGGLKSHPFGATGFFRTHFDGDRWWFVTPQGNAFISLGVCFLNSTGDAERGTNYLPYRENILKKYGSIAAWKSATLSRIKEWNINTLGGWCGPELRADVPYTVELGMSRGLWLSKQIPDLFTPKAEGHIRAHAADLDVNARDPYLIGYYLDNELPWARDYRFGPDIFPAYMALPSDAPGKKKLIAFFQDRYKTPANFSAVWKARIDDWNDIGNFKKLKPRDSKKAQEDQDAFALLVARQYFKLTTEAIRAKDPNHLILGCRFIWMIAPKPAVQACGEYCDAISLNYYEMGFFGRAWLWWSSGGSMRLPTDLSFRSFYDVAQKPLLMTEFSFRAKDSGMPNSYPPRYVAQPTVANQKERADRFEQCATTWTAQPYVIGYHWFQYMDEPKTGRFDGENGNYGIVSIEDEPYSEFVERLKDVNARAWELHSTSKGTK